jgi:hypothetical protein
MKSIALTAIVSFVLCNQISANLQTPLTTRSTTDVTFTQTVKGQQTNISCDQDVVSFSTKFLSKEYISALSKEGFNGFAKVKDVDWDKLVEKQDYVEILKIIWTEKDHDVAIAHLEPEAKKGHAILMLELHRTLCEKMKAENKFPTETLKAAFTWYIHGIQTTILDIACNTDNSTQAAVDMLRYSYAPGNLISPSEWQKFDIRAFGDSIIKNLELPASYPSPKWVTYHGMAIFRGENSLLPEAEWNGKRAAKFQAIKGQ